MKYNTTIAGQLSGSIGGITGSHNGMGYYLRKKVIPVNSNTSGQTTMRNFFATLTAQWGTLTQAQRNSWITYAANVPRTDALSALINLTGLNWFVAVNTLRLQSGLTIVTTASPLFTMATLTTPVGTVTAAGTTMSIAFGTDASVDLWRLITGGALAVFASAPFSPSRLYFKGPYRFAGKILGNTGTPPTSPQTITKPYTYVATQLVGLKFVAIDSVGRISSPIRQIVTVT